MSASPSLPRRLAFLAWCGLVFFQPFNQFGAFRNLFLALLLITLVLVAVDARKAPRTLFPSGSWLPALGIGLLLWVAVVSLAGPYPEESLEEIRKGMLPQIALFLAPLYLARTRADLLRLTAVALAGFGLVSLLSATEVFGHLIEKRGFERVVHVHDSWTGGYGTNGGFYIPLLAGWLMLPESRSRWQQAAGWSLMVLSLVLVVLYGSRTALVVIPFALLTIAVFHPQRRNLLVAGVVAGGLFLVSSIPTINSQNDYQKLLRADTYLTNEGLSARHGVWAGVAELIRLRPVTGYGYGWKKLAWAINDQGFDQAWKSDEGKASYFLSTDGRAVYGRVNPHSYYLQVAFEIGLPGLGLVLLFWGRLLFECRGLLLKNEDASSRAFAVMVLSMLSGYFVANLTNGHWVGGLANLSLTLAACLVVLRRDQVKASSTTT